MPQQKFNGGHFAEYADAMGVGYAIDVHRGVRNRDVILDRKHHKLEIKANADLGEMRTLDFDAWLPFASKEYHTSSNITDYILVPVITMPSDLPNRNGVGFPLTQLTKFNIEQGRIAYKTFAGKPMHIEHDNQDPTKAVGIIVDAAMRKMANYGSGKVWKLLELLAVDRTKNPTLAAKVISGEQNAYSMGAWVGGYDCGYCGAAMGECAHLHPNQPRDFYEINGSLVYRKVRDICGFETSAVEIPAYVSAIQTRIFDTNGLDKIV